MITSLLIANRGEIACRVIRTARRLGIRTVAVYSDADADALHVRSADVAVHIGPSPVRESYLRGDRIIAAALATGAEAIHPGYGFLSENAGFAQAVMDAGLVWVGPDPASITAMGLKDAAKALMAEAGVPVTPGYMGDNQDVDHLAGEATRIGYPVLIKAVAGGGGKGMRLVEEPADFADALASCQREAASSFGNAHVLIEKYIQRPRHIEVQIFGDKHGGIVHLFERDCSLQRRHQKVLEEAPSPALDAAGREKIGKIVVDAIKAIGYLGVGTIEFLWEDGEFFFIEMNTRLQVEHPVTEAITGVDLVREQVRIAAGLPLSFTQDDIHFEGHSIEVRVNAENPETFTPSPGVVTDFHAPGGLGVRLDSAIYTGYSIPPYYDSLIGKLIVHGRDREEAIARLKRSLGEMVVGGVDTTIPLFQRLLAEPDILSGDYDIHWLEKWAKRQKGEA